jgi:hypothetical protein
VLVFAAGGVAVGESGLSLALGILFLLVAGLIAFFISKKRLQVLLLNLIPCILKPAPCTLRSSSHH